ncbi:MAG: hypothetical protein DRN92_04730, partial [Thermoproteota archaeon]
MGLVDASIRKHRSIISQFLRQVGKPINTITREDIRTYLAYIKDRYSIGHYANIVKSLKRFFRDYLGREELVASLKIPKARPKVVKLPTKEELKLFYEHIKDLRGKVLFLLFA